MADERRKELDERIRGLERAIQERLHALGTQRESRHIVVRRFSEKTGLSKSYVSKVENLADVPAGKRDEYSMPTIPRLARYLAGLDITLSEFFSELEPPRDEREKASHKKLHVRLQWLLDRGDEIEVAVAQQLTLLEKWSQSVKETKAPKPHLGKTARAKKTASG
jgi:transcriptional regulator with XRE-family HTH domain